jgi:hypothetical protein
MFASPRRRRPRAVFHYKVDELLAPADRPAYLALLHDPRTRIDDAHAWLTARGYALSRSAVARHRRRLLAGAAEQHAAERKALAFARFASAGGGADFAAGTLLQFQHMVFQRVLEAGGAGHLLREDQEHSAANGDASPEPERIDSTELLRLSKLVCQCIDMSHRQLEADRARSARQPAAPLTPEEKAARDAALRQRIEEILAGRG